MSLQTIPTCIWHLHGCFIADTTQQFESSEENISVTQSTRVVVCDILFTYHSFLFLLGTMLLFFLQGNNRYPSNLNGGIDATVSQCHLHMALYLPSQKETTW